MKRKILEIINKNGIRDAGFCDYSLVKERLLPCRALQRLPDGKNYSAMTEEERERLFPTKGEESR